MEVDKAALRYLYHGGFAWWEFFGPRTRMSPALLLPRIYEAAPMFERSGSRVEVEPKRQTPPRAVLNPTFACSLCSAFRSLRKLCLLHEPTR